MKDSIMIMDSGDEILVNADSLSERDKICRFICPVCRRRAFLNISRIDGKGNWFSSNEHTPECPLAKGGRVFRTPDGQEFHIGDALRHIDRPIDIASPLPVDSPAGLVGKDEPEENLGPDNIMLYEPDRYRTCSTIYKGSSGLRTDDLIMDGMTVGDFLIDYRGIEKARTGDLEGIKMFILRRCNPKFMNPAITVSRDYVLLRDPYTIDDRKAAYVQIRFAEESHDKQFRDRLFGDKKRGIEPDPRRYIVAMGRVTRIEDPNYTIYKLSPVSSARLCFIKDIRK